MIIYQIRFLELKLKKQNKKTKQTNKQNKNNKQTNKQTNQNKKKRCETKQYEKLVDQITHV